jgi:hypothetical protein
MNFSSSNKKRIHDLEAYNPFSTEFDYYIDFLKDLSNLFSYNGITISCIIDNKIHFLDTGLIESSVQTLKSIKSCCSIGSFSDANTLIRKLRDDLLLYIFILDTIKNRKTFNEDDLSNLDLKTGDFDAEKFTSAFLNLRFNDVLTENEQAVNAWFNNAVNDLNRKIKMKLSFENYMIQFQKNPSISEILVNYNLQGYWEKLRNKLNDYVHNNGNEFTRQNNVSANDKFVETHLKNINFRISYISSFFLVLLIMIDSKLIAATDLIDHLDSNAEPPQDSQYFVAPFVKDFLDLKVSKLHPELKQYLKDNNDYQMKI